MAKNNQDNKKGLPGSFFLFLVTAILVVLAIQNLLGGKDANISFSYQVEHLVNLDLIQPQASRKVALKENLVTFSGKFRERLNEESKERYKYLKLLDTNYNLSERKSELEADGAAFKANVREASDWFLHLSGIAIPKNGYRVVDEIFDIPGQENRIVIQKLSEKKLTSLKEIKGDYDALRNPPSSDSLDEVGDDIDALITNFRAPVLGIGDEKIKQQLRELEDKIDDAKAADVDAIKKLTAYNEILTQLQATVNQLNAEKNHVRLNQLRSVRNYVDTLREYQSVIDSLEENNVKLAKARKAVSDVTWYYKDQELSTRALERQSADDYQHWFSNAQEEWQNFPENQGARFKAPDQPRNMVLDKVFKSEEPAPNYFSYFFTILPILLVLLLLYFVFSRQMKGMGGSGAMSFGKSPAKLLNKEQNKVTFKDVAGIDEAREELEEIVDFLKKPSKFTSLGGKIPKGVLCVGPPGTGKTLVARAVAGEADRPFFSISGSDFVEMFVGVGASRIRDMFEQAKKNAPCIVFIDEIDAVGRHRGSGIGGGHDEREQTLNQLLVEMDGFDTNEGVIIVAATNRPDVLDKALLRPGRFDRKIMIDLPDIKGRYHILKVHARKIKLDPSVDLMNIARATAGSSGADLENLLNEAALLAARKGRKAVTTQDTAEATDKVRYGKERRSLELDEDEKKTTSYHESGHALVALMVEKADPVEKVTIIPRGFSLGATHFLPEKNKLGYWKSEIIDQLAVLMGGRAAEELFLKDLSSGAQQDITQATKLARSMVCSWGMSENLGTVAYDDSSSQGQMGGMPGYYEKKYSESSAQAIDKEVRELIGAAHRRAIDLLQGKNDKVHLMASMLMEFETLDSTDCKKILAGEWDIEEKRKRLDEISRIQMKPIEPPPPPHDVPGVDQDKIESLDKEEE
ncbi:MAG: ATP-dependent zinc metalloprotease FtsH [Chlamydiota bacterium]